MEQKYNSIVIELVIDSIPDFVLSVCFSCLPSVFAFVFVFVFVFVLGEHIIFSGLRVAG
jgi:hypothetical protein